MWLLGHCAGNICTKVLQRVVVIGQLMSLLALIKVWNHYISCRLNGKIYVGICQFPLAASPSDSLSQFQQHSLHFSFHAHFVLQKHLSVITPTWPAANKWLSLGDFGKWSVFDFQESVKNVCIWFPPQPSWWTVRPWAARFRIPKGWVFFFHVLAPKLFYHYLRAGRLTDSRKRHFFILIIKLFLHDSSSIMFASLSHKQKIVDRGYDWRIYYTVSMYQSVCLCMCVCVCVCVQVWVCERERIIVLELLLHRGLFFSFLPFFLFFSFWNQRL